jgi:hypothetical protein
VKGVLKGYTPIKSIIGIFLYVFILVQALLLQVLNGYGIEYYDGILYGLRYLLLFLLVNYLVNKSPILTLKIFIILVIVLVFISISAILFFGYEGILNGRINFIGMGPNVSSDLAIMVLSLAILAERNKWIGRFWLYSCLIAVFIYVPVTGSRRAMVFLFLCLLYWNPRFVFFTISALALSYFFYFSHLFTDVNIEGFVSVTRVLESISQLSNGNFEDGRSLVLKSILLLLNEFPLGVGLSDWAIQSEFSLQPGGISSHSHNWILQFFLKFGVISVVLISVLLIYCVSFLKDGYFFHAGFIFISMMSGYGWWNIKWVTTLLFFLLFLRASHHQFSLFVISRR